MKQKTDTMQEQLENKKKSKDAGSEIFDELWDYLKMIAILVGIIFILNEFVIINARIPSPSMENTIMVGDQIFGNRLAYKFNDPNRYDIVIFRYPDDEKQYFIKRIIGLPGETVNIVDGKVYIDDAAMPLDDSFCPEVPQGDFGPYEVPEDSYFMMGDNRNMSADSRYWINTYVKRDKILGKAVLRYWPLTKFGVVD